MRRSLFHFVAAVSMVAAGMVSAVQAAVVSFGSGANQFNMEFVTIGNPGNTADTTGNPNPAGSVGYSYGIAKYEVSEQMVQVYNNLGPVPIINSSRGPKKPVTGISWNESARFVNWLNTSKGFTPAYKFTATGATADDSRSLQISLWDPTDTLDYDPANRIRSKRAVFALPSYNEWYKAAYYDPKSGTYFDYPTGSNTAPSITTGGTTPNTAVYSTHGPADVDFAGGLSAYGVMALGGNVMEHEESTFDLLNLPGPQVRGRRGGWWSASVADLSSSTRYAWEAGHRDFVDGFRVVQLYGSPAAVPEPTSMAIFGLGALGMAYRSRRRKST
ncbi:MAG: SUMF1/EgtB/PvdO family nonheme iron enzyme [Pirellula sp.]